MFSFPVVRPEIDIQLAAISGLLTGHHIVDNVVCHIDRRNVVDDIDFYVDREPVAVGILNDHLDGIGIGHRIVAVVFAPGKDRFVQGVVPLTVQSFFHVAMGPLAVFGDVDNRVTVGHCDRFRDF